MQHYSDRAFIDRYPLSPKKIWKKMVQGVWANQCRQLKKIMAGTRLVSVALL
jgi:hypothetical protein